MSLSDIINPVMSLIYLGCGIFLIVGENIFGFVDLQRYSLAGLLIIYGLFRLINFIRKKKEERNDYEEF